MRKELSRGRLKGEDWANFSWPTEELCFSTRSEICPYQMQAKLLRVLQEGEIDKVGRQRNIPIDVRVIAATNRRLEEMVQRGRVP